MNTRFSFNFDGVFSQVFDHLAPSILNPNRRGSASPKTPKHHTMSVTTQSSENDWLFDYMMNVFRAPTWEVRTESCCGFMVAPPSTIGLFKT